MNSDLLNKKLLKKLKQPFLLRSQLGICKLQSKTRLIEVSNLDGYYSQSVEASVKAVMQYIRDKPLLTEDGDKLITKVFSIHQPIFAFKAAVRSQE
ncbi:TIGR02391 family protein [Trichormus azollae]|uniref:TIGR02391 family protein n=1 Tax=Trichormus azollae TaxID=1164 RepID=UPI003D346DA6